KILKKFIKPPKPEPVRKKRTINSIEEYQNILLRSRFITIEEHKYCLTMATDVKSGFVCLCLSNKRDILSRNRFIEHIEYFLKERGIAPKFIGETPSTHLKGVRSIKFSGDNWGYHRNFSTKIFKEFLIFKDKFKSLVSEKINLTLLYLYQLTTCGGKSITPLIVSDTDSRFSIIFDKDEEERLKRRALVVLDQKFRSHNSENKLEILDLRESLGIDFTNTMVMKEKYLHSNLYKMNIEKYYDEVIDNKDIPIDVKIKYYIRNSNIKLYLGEYEEAEKLVLKAYKISKKEKYGEGVLRALISACYIIINRTENYDFKNYLKRISLFVSNDSSIEIKSKYKLLLADIHQKNKNYNLAELFFKELIDMLENIEEGAMRLENVYYRYSLNSLYLGKHKKALSLALKLESLISKYSFLDTPTYNFRKSILFAQVYMNNKNNDKAIYYLNVGEKIAKNFSQKHTQLITLYNLFTLFYLEHDKNYKIALNYAKKALEVAVHTENSHYIKYCKKNILVVKNKLNK
ncbi:MAG: hypothetical protein CR982_01795, partial [Candidatus Cloacimonadota bacterium]